MNTTLNNRIQKIMDRISETDKKIKDLYQLKRDLHKQLQQAKEDELFSYVKGLNVSIDVLSSDVEIGKIIRESGLTKKDIETIINNEKQEEQV